MKRAVTDSVLILVVLCGSLWALTAADTLDQSTAVRLAIAGVVGTVAYRLGQGVRVEGDPDLTEDERSEFERAVRRAEEPVTVPATELARLQILVASVASGASDLHVRLRPVLREIAAERLRTRRGVDLDTSPAAARRLLGDQLYDVVRSDRPATRDRGSSGVPPAVITAMVDALEAL